MDVDGTYKEREDGIWEKEAAFCDATVFAK